MFIFIYQITSRRQETQKVIKCRKLANQKKKKKKKTASCVNETKITRTSVSKKVKSEVCQFFFSLCKHK